MTDANGHGHSRRRALWMVAYHRGEPIGYFRQHRRDLAELYFGFGGTERRHAEFGWDTGLEHRQHYGRDRAYFYRRVESFSNRWGYDELLLDSSPLAHAMTHSLRHRCDGGSCRPDGHRRRLSGPTAQQVTAQFSDAAGNSSTTSVLSFTLDTVAPAVAITTIEGSDNMIQRRRSGGRDHRSPARRRSARR